MINLHHEIRTPLTIILLGMNTYCTNGFLSASQWQSIKQASIRLLATSRNWGNSEAINVAKTIASECNNPSEDSFAQITKQVKSLEVQLNRLID